MFEEHLLRQLEEVTPYADFSSSQGEYLASRSADPITQESPVSQLRYTDYSFLPGCFGRDGSVYFAGYSTSEIHKCSLEGDIEANYYLGTDKLHRDAKRFLIDPDDKLHALVLHLPFHLLVRRFEDADTYFDTPLDLQGLQNGEAGFGLDMNGNSYVLSNCYREWRVHRFSEDGALVDTIIVESPEDEINDSGVRLPYLPLLMVLPSGDLFVFAASWAT